MDSLLRRSFDRVKIANDLHPIILEGSPLPRDIYSDLIPDLDHDPSMYQDTIGRIIGLEINRLDPVFDNRAVDGRANARYGYDSVMQDSMAQQEKAYDKKTSNDCTRKREYHVFQEAEDTGKQDRCHNADYQPAYHLLF